MKILFTISFILIAFCSWDQKISGFIKDENGKSLSGANVTLKKVTDSSIIKIGVTNTLGEYVLLNIEAGKYFLVSSYVGYADKTSAIIDMQEKDIILPDVLQDKTSMSMQAVVVTGKKPMVEVKADKTILNVEGTINSIGNDVIDLLRKAPGVSIDKDDNIELAGKTGVRIYIDGKPTPLSGSDLASYLKSIQSAEIESIELITNPSAKYEAAGNAGIINIRLKKNKGLGTNGSVNLGYSFSQNSKYNSGLALNHRNKRVNLFSNMNYSPGRVRNNLLLYRQQMDTIFGQLTKGFYKSKSLGFKGGVDYFINNKQTLGVMINGNMANFNNNIYSNTPIVYKPSGVTDRILKAGNNGGFTRDNVNINVNYRWADTAGHVLNIDGDYGFFRIKSDQMQPNAYYTPDFAVKLSEVIYSFIAPTGIDIYTLKADYEQGYKGGKLGLGAKTSVVASENRFTRYDIRGNTSQLDIHRSNQFEYTENINAVYLNYNKSWMPKGIIFQAGLRVENTNSSGDSYGLMNDGTVNYSSPSSLTRKYTDFFPSASITFNRNPSKQWTFAYSRRIDRPGYQDLNPFEFKLDEYTFQKGNTSLKPQYTNTVSLTSFYKNKITSSLSFSHVADVFTQLIDTVDKTKAFITKKNLATQNIANLNFSFPYSHRDYNLIFTFNTYFSHFRADLGGDGRILDLQVFSYNLSAQQSLKFGEKKNWTAELSGFYNAPGIFQGTFKSNANYAIDAGLQRSFLNGAGSLKIAISDILNTIRFVGVSNFAGQYLRAENKAETRYVKLSFTYRFGSSQVKASRNRKSGAEEESGRVN